MKSKIISIVTHILSIAIISCVFIFILNSREKYYKGVISEYETNYQKVCDEATTINNKALSEIDELRAEIDKITNRYEKELSKNAALENETKALKSVKSLMELIPETSNVGNYGYFYSPVYTAKVGETFKIYGQYKPSSSEYPHILWDSSLHEQGIYAYQYDEKTGQFGFAYSCNVPGVYNVYLMPPSTFDSLYHDCETIIYIYE